MKIEICNYKNIKKLEFNIEKNKINYLFGISGTGKSSIVSAITGDLSEKNIPYGMIKNDMFVKVDSNNILEDFLIFNDDMQKKLILEKNNNDEFYNILFSNDDSLEKIRKNIREILSSINAKRHELLDYVTKVDEMIKFINKRKLSSTKKFSENSAISNLKKESENPKYKKYATYVHNNGSKYVEWIEEGKKFNYFENDKCPFCMRKISSHRKEKLLEISKISPEQYKIITDSKDIFNKLGIEIPNFYYKREIVNLEKNLYDAINNKDIIINMFNMIDSYNMDTMDINNILKIKFSESLINLFPEMKNIIEEFNNNLSILKKDLGNIKKNTTKILGNNLKKLNDYLNRFTIPYKFVLDRFNVAEKKASVFLISNKDNLHQDRIDNLSYGEKNIIALLIFLVSANKNNIIIDDPASSYDDNKRKIIYELLYEFSNDRTFIILSHDQVFIKYALLGIERNKNNQSVKYFALTGNVMCIENVNGVCSIKKIEINDFDMLDNQVLEYIKSNDLNYYRKIINLRILTEINKKNSAKDRIIYEYLSAILHNKDKNIIKEELEKKNTNEDEVLSNIMKIYGIEIEHMPDNIYYDFEYEKMTIFEKVVYQREQERIKRGQKRTKSFLEKEFDDIVHLNTRYFLSLNPYKYNIYSDNIYKNI